MEAWINGKLIDETKARVSLFDRSYLYGEGVFETLRCYAGKPAFFDRHYARLTRNAKKLEIPLHFSEKELNTAAHQLLIANQLQEAVVRITVSTVGASFGVGRPKNRQTNITIFCRPIEIDPKLFETGVKVLPLQTLINDSPEIAGIKSTSYITKMIARAEAAKAGAYESLLKNSKGYWVEGSRTNLFIVLDQTVITAPLSDGILNGITREVVLEIVQEKQIAHRENHITEVMLQNADEIFLTGSTSEVLPVCEVIGVWKKNLPQKALISSHILKTFRQGLATLL